MPHDATPDNGRMRPFRAPPSKLGLALVAILALGVAVIAAAGGVFLFALPGIAVAVVAYGAYYVLARRSSLPRNYDWPRAERTRRRASRRV